MRFSTAATLPRVDLSLVESVVPLLREEWAGLRFDPSGALINPLTGALLPDLRLVDGAHRRPGARYEVAFSLSSPAPGSAEALLRTDSTPPTTASVRLRTDDARTLAFTVADLNDLWSVDVDITHGRLPRVALALTADATRLIRREGSPGCLAGLFGGTATASAQLDPGALVAARQGTIADGSGRYNRLRGSASAQVRTTSSGWDVEARAQLRARGLARPLLWGVRRKIRASVDASLATFWKQADPALADAERWLRLAAAIVEQEGGIARVVHRSLWDSDYLEELERRHGLT